MNWHNTCVFKKFDSMYTFLLYELELKTALKNALKSVCPCPGDLIFCSAPSSALSQQ